MSVKRGFPDGIAATVEREVDDVQHEAVVAALRDARLALAELRASLER